MISHPSINSWQQVEKLDPTLGCGFWQMFCFSELIAPQAEEGAAYGAAILAMVGVGA